MKKIIPFIFAALLCGCAGCTSRTITYGGATYRSVRFANKENIDAIEITTTTNSAKVVLRGYKNDQVQAIGVAVDAAVSAAINSAK